MMRSLTILPLIFSLVLGPNTCCCTVRGIASQFGLHANASCHWMEDDSSAASPTLKDASNPTAHPATSCSENGPTVVSSSTAPRPFKRSCCQNQTNQSSKSTESRSVDRANTVDQVPSCSNEDHSNCGCMATSTPLNVDASHSLQVQVRLLGDLSDWIPKVDRIDGMEFSGLSQSSSLTHRSGAARCALLQRWNC
jgi:hypothetical protein